MTISDALKKTAIVVMAIMMAGAVVGGFSLLSYDDTTVYGVIVLVFGALGAWVSYLLLTGFGILVEQAETNQDEKTKKAYQPMYGNAAQKTAPADGWKCTSCGRTNPNYQTTCSCGAKKPH